MAPQQFVIWFKGFTEACNDFHPTPKQWDRIKEVLDEVEDYNDNPGLDVEIDDWYNISDKIPGQPRSPYVPPITPYVPPYFTGDPPGWLRPYSTSGTITIPSGSGSSISFGTSTNASSSTFVWNDKMGCWHYTNHPEGFGYFTNTTLGAPVPEETKKQLLD